MPDFTNLLTGYTLFFTTLCMVLACMVVLEVISAAIAGSSVISEGLDHILDGLNPGILDWFKIRDLPGSVAVYSFLYGFALTGLALVGYLLPDNALSFVLACVAGVFVGSAVVKAVGLVLGPLFKVQTQSFSEKELIGRFVEIKDARCAVGFAAEAKVISENGDMLNTYVMVEPQDPEVSFVSGNRVRIIGQSGNVFKVA